MEAKRATLWSCCLSCFIAWLDYAIVNTALPAIQQNLSASLAQLQWVMNAFVLAITVCIVMLGRLSDHWGRKKMNLLGVGLFGLASLLAGFAPSPGWLIFGRLVQGIGCSAIIPTSLALISHAFPGEEKAKAIGIWSGVLGLGMAIGPTVGGFLVSALSWRWIFFVNVPFALISLLITALFVHESCAERALKPDYKGFCLLATGMAALIFTLMHAPDWGWLSFKTLILLAIAVIILTVFFVLEKRSEAPTIPLDLLSLPSFFYSVVVMSSLVFVFTACLFLIPLYLIQVRGQAAYQAGLTILPITACIAILSPFVGKWVPKISNKKLVLAGLFLFLLSTLLQTFFEIETSILLIFASFICLGIGWALARTPATISAIASAPAHYAGTASGVLWTIQNASGALSIAITLTLFRRIAETSFLTGYATAMWLLTGVTLATFLSIAFFMRPSH